MSFIHDLWSPRVLRSEESHGQQKKRLEKIRYLCKDIYFESKNSLNTSRGRETEF